MGRCSTNYGWKDNGNGYFIPHWFDGESLPQKANIDDEKIAETVDEGTEIREDDAENYGDHDAVNLIEGEYDADTPILKKISMSMIGLRFLRMVNNPTMIDLMIVRAKMMAKMMMKMIFKRRLNYV
ncbi:hypothetical protein SNE40_005983 [Patella caerulea]|uniref:Uncharacterized protein n=1 Tax=Patella caerulea TaxID=87958 RepID=A0AAN8K1H4_PATCE